jgi:DNA-binding phage protein
VEGVSEQSGTVVPVKNYRDDLLVRLSDPNYLALYLKAALDATLEDGNREAFLLALENVVGAQSTKQEVVSHANISRQHLHKLLSERSSLTLETLATILNAVGLAIDFGPVFKAAK